MRPNRSTVAATQAAIWSGSPALAANTAVSPPAVPMSSAAASSASCLRDESITVGARLGEGGGDRLADPAAGAGDQRDLSVQADLHPQEANGRSTGRRDDARDRAAAQRGRRTIWVCVTLATGRSAPSDDHRLDHDRRAADVEGRGDRAMAVPSRTAPRKFVFDSMRRGARRALGQVEVGAGGAGGVGQRHHHPAVQHPVAPCTGPARGRSPDATSSGAGGRRRACRACRTTASTERTKVGGLVGRHGRDGAAARTCRR